MKLLIASWGDPWGWKEVSYLLNDKEIKSLSSVKAIAQAEEVDKTLIFIQESLLAASRTKKNKDKLEIIKRPYPDPLEELKKSDNPAKNYLELLHALKIGLQKFTNEQVQLTNKFRVFVAPSIGQFSFFNEKGEAKIGIWKINEELNSNILAFYKAFVILATLSELLKFNEEDEVRLYVDITHGLNYTPVALSEGAYIAGQLYSLLTAKLVTFRVFNSEPFIGKAKTPLNIHIVKEEKITPFVALIDLLNKWSRFYSKESLDPYFASKDIIGKLGADYSFHIRKPTNNLKALGEYALMSAFYSLPLLFLQAGYEAQNESIYEYLSKTISWLLQNYPIVSVEVKDEHFKVVHNYAFNLEHLILLLLIFAGASFAKKTWNKFETSVIDNTVLADVDFLESFSKEWLHSPFKLVTLNEISQFKRKDAKEGIFQAYRKSLEEDCKGSEIIWSEEGGIPDNRRILVAHSGFNKNAIEIICFNGKPYLRYKPKVLEAVKNAARSLLGEFFIPPNT